MPILKKCGPCQYRLISLKQAEDSTVYPCLSYDCVKLKDIYSKYKKEDSSMIIPVTKYYFDKNVLTEGDVVCIKDKKTETEYPAILFYVETDKIIAMRDSGDRQTSQVIIRPEDVAGKLFDIKKIDWKKCLC